MYMSLLVLGGSKRVPDIDIIQGYYLYVQVYSVCRIYVSGVIHLVILIK